MTLVLERLKGIETAKDTVPAQNLLGQAIDFIPGNKRRKEGILVYYVC